jgi:hypothetical protein
MEAHRAATFALFWIVVVGLYRNFYFVHRMNNEIMREYDTDDVVVATLIDDQVMDIDIESALEHFQKDATVPSFRLFWRECPYIRFSYHCQGDRYDNYTNFYNPLVASQLLQNDPIRFQGGLFNKDIFIVGNSHTGQIAEELFCLLYDHIVDFKGTNLATACLESFSKEERCDGYGVENNCGMYLAAATIQKRTNDRDDTFRILLANNHPYLFSGEKGIQTLIAKMNMNVSKIGTIIVGGWNDAKSWAKDFLSPKFTRYPTPAFGKECGLSFEHDFVADRPDVVGILKELGFDGKVYRDFYGRKSPSHDFFPNNALPNNVLPFPVSIQPKRGCMVENCDENNWGKHVCKYRTIYLNVKGMELKFDFEETRSLTYRLLSVFTFYFFGRSSWLPCLSSSTGFVFHPLATFEKTNFLQLTVRKRPQRKKVSHHHSIYFQLGLTLT